MEASSSIPPTTEFPWAKCALGCEFPENQEINFLPCLHVLCSIACLDKLSEEMEQKKAKPHCKKCLRHFTFDQVKRNVKLEDFLKKKVQPNAVILRCGSCIVDDPVESYCVQCRLDLCSPCTAFHPRLKGKTDHKLDKDLEQRKLNQLEELRNKQKQCDSHEGKMSTGYCFTCQKQMCSECEQEHDKNHEKMNIAEELKAIEARITSTKEASGLINLSISMLTEKIESLKGPEWTSYVTSLDDLMMKILNTMAQRRQALFLEGRKQLLGKVKAIENRIKVLNRAKLDSSLLLSVFEDISEDMGLNEIGMINIARTSLPKSEDLGRTKEFLAKNFDDFVEKDKSIVINDEGLSDLQALFLRFGSVEERKTPADSSPKSESDSDNQEAIAATCSAKLSTLSTPNGENGDQVVSATPLTPSKDSGEQVAPPVTPEKDSKDHIMSPSKSSVTKTPTSSKDSGEQVAPPATPGMDSTNGMISSATKTTTTNPSKDTGDLVTSSPKPSTVALTPSKDSSDPNPTTPSKQVIRRIATKSTAGRLNGRPLGMPHLKMVQPIGGLDSMKTKAATNGHPISPSPSTSHVTATATPPIKTYLSPVQKANLKIDDKVTAKNEPVEAKNASKEEPMDKVKVTSKNDPVEAKNTPKDEPMDVDLNLDVDVDLKRSRTRRKSDGGVSTTSAETEIMLELSPQPENDDDDSEERTNGKVSPRDTGLAEENVADQNLPGTSKGQGAFPTVPQPSTSSGDCRTSKRERKRKVFSDCVDPDDALSNGSPKPTKSGRRPGRPSKKQQRVSHDDDQEEEDSEISNLMSSIKAENNGTSSREESGRRSSLRRRKTTENKNGECSKGSDASGFLDAPAESIQYRPRWCDYPIQGKLDVLKKTDYDDNDDYCFICLDGGEDVIVCCDSCPRVFHLECHIPILRSIPEGDEKWTCNYCKSKEMVEEEMQNLSDEPGSEEKPLTENNPRQFALACKMIMEVHKIDEIPTMKWVFPDAYLMKFNKAPYHLKFLREKLCLPKKKGQEPFANVKEFMSAFRQMFLQAFRIYEKSNKDRKPAVRCFKKFQQLVKDYYPEHQKLFENVLEG